MWQRSQYVVVNVTFISQQQTLYWWLFAGLGLNNHINNNRFIKDQIKDSRVQKEKTKNVHFPMQFCFSPLSVVQQSYSSPTSSYLSTVYFLIKQTQQLIFKQRHKKDSRAVTSHVNTSIKRWETLPILEQRLPKQLWWANPMGEICHSYVLHSALSSN